MPEALDPPELEELALLVAEASNMPIESARSIAARAFALGVRFHERLTQHREAALKLGVEIPVLRETGS